MYAPKAGVLPLVGLWQDRVLVCLIVFCHASEGMAYYLFTCGLGFRRAIAGDVLHLETSDRKLSDISFLDSPLARVV